MKLRSRILLVALLMVIVPIVAVQIQRNVFANQAPVASFTYSPAIPTPGETITFNASASYDPDGSILKYSWDFGDGNTATVTNPIITYSYPLDGAYTVELTVTDNNQATGVAAAVVEVSTVAFFRVCFYGSLIPIPNVVVTAYYYNGAAYVKAPVGPHGLEIKYDNMTPPGNVYRNPGYTASNLLHGASNIGFDVHPATWTVYFKFEWCGQVAYWPNDTARVYTYEHGSVEAHDYLPGHQAYKDPGAGTYVIKVNDIPGHGVAPTECHPIIVGVKCPPPIQKYYLTVKTDPSSIPTIPGQGWYTKGTNVTLTAPSYVNVSSDTRYRFNYWDVDGTSKGSGVNPIVVGMNANHTATAHYVSQYLATFYQTGLSSDATGTIVVVDGSGKTYADLSYSKWVDSGGTITYSYSSTVSSSISGKQYRLTGVTGLSSPITVTGPVSVKGCYIKQYSVTFAQTGLDSTATGTVVTVNGNTKSYSQLPYVLWVDCGSTVTYSYASTVSSSATGKRFRLNSVTGPASPITVTGATTVTGNYVNQFSVTFSAGLDPTATGTVLTVNGIPKTYADLPYVLWADSGSSITYSYNDPVLSTTSGKRFRLTSVIGPSSPFTVTGAVSVSGTYNIQFQVSFDQTGVGLDFAGTVVTVDSVSYNRGALPVSFWWDSGSPHGFSFASPLVVNASKQYGWSSTTGLTTLQSGTLTISTSGSVTGNYLTGNSITFDQTGVSSDFTGTVLTVDSTPYEVSALPVSFLWQPGSTHGFSFQSPLLVTADSKQYVWTSTSGLSSSQSDSITVSGSGNVVGHYKTQYYLTLATNPSGIASPSTAGWYDANTYASISTTAFVDIIAGSSRYRFVNWTTADMTEIASPSSTSTTVFMDMAKTVTANYVTQYKATFDQTGIGVDFTGPVVTIDGVDYYVSGLPVSFWWDQNSQHTIVWHSPLVVTANAKQYAWTSSTGLFTSQSGTMTVTTYGAVTGNYGIQYYLTVTSPYGTTGGEGWYNSGDTAYATLNTSSIDHGNGTGHVFTSWSDDASGTNYAQSDPITMNGAKTAAANWRIQYYLTMATSPPAVNTPTGTGWYDAGASAAISTDAFVDITPGISRYRFNGWTTPDMSEITDPTRSPTTVRVDNPKTVTANYIVQYKISFSQSGASSDFSGNVLTVDAVGYNVGSLPKDFWWDSSSLHNFAFNSPLVVTANSKQYLWTSSTGLSTSQSSTITVSGSGSVTGNYETQYYLTVSINPPGIAIIPGQGWYDASAAATLTAPSVSGYQFSFWDVDGTSRGAGINPITVTLSAAHAATAHYNPVGPQLAVTINPLSATIYPGDRIFFNSTVAGGTSPYRYQWYLNDNPVSSATSNTWTFMPTAPGVYYVYLKATDALNNTAQSATARIAVLSVPVGGDSVSLAKSVWPLLICYATLLAMFIVTISLMRRKRK
jgi:hypothetical protein